MKSLFIENPDIVIYHKPLASYWFMDVCPLDENFMVSFCSELKDKKGDSPSSHLQVLHFVARHNKINARELALYQYVFMTILLDYLPHQFYLKNQDIYFKESLFSAHKLEKGFNEYFFHVECYLPFLNQIFDFSNPESLLENIKDFSVKLALNYVKLIEKFNQVPHL